MAIDIDQFLQQKLVLWERTGSGVSGEALFAQPVELDCRWDDAQQQVMVDGRVVISSAMIMSAVRLPVGSVVRLGTLAEWQALSIFPKTPIKKYGGFEVMRSDHTPDLDGSELLYTAYL